MAAAVVSRVAPVDNDSLRPKEEYLVQNGQALQPTTDSLKKTDFVFPKKSIKSRWTIEEQIGSGGFGAIYKAYDTEKKLPVAIKVEKRQGKCYLDKEVLFYNALEKSRKPGSVRASPRCHWAGTESNFKIAVFDLMGPSLSDLFYACHRKFSLKCVLMLAQQLVSRLEAVHEAGIVHRDVKPGNFVIGLGADASNVFAIDFGLSNFWKANNRHIPFNSDSAFRGTHRYASVNSHMKCEQSRRDDMEALAYVLIYFIKGGLPWQSLKVSRNKRRKAIGKFKANLSPAELTSGLPSQFTDFLTYVKGLKFDEQPDYKYCRDLFKASFEEHQFVDDGVFDWTNLPPSALHSSQFKPQNTQQQTQQTQQHNQQIQQQQQQNHVILDGQQQKQHSNQGIVRRSPIPSSIPSNTQNLIANTSSTHRTVVSNNVNNTTRSNLRSLPSSTKTSGIPSSIPNSLNGLMSSSQVMQGKPDAMFSQMNNFGSNSSRGSTQQISSPMTLQGPSATSSNDHSHFVQQMRPIPAFHHAHLGEVPRSSNNASTSALHQPFNWQQHNFGTNITVTNNSPNGFYSGPYQVHSTSSSDELGAVHSPPTLSQQSQPSQQQQQQQQQQHRLQQQMIGKMPPVASPIPLWSFYSRAPLSSSGLTSGSSFAEYSPSSSTVLSSSSSTVARSPNGSPHPPHHGASQSSMPVVNLIDLDEELTSYTAVSSQFNPLLAPLSTSPPSSSHESPVPCFPTNKSSSTANSAANGHCNSNSLQWSSDSLVITDCIGSFETNQPTNSSQGTRKRKHANITESADSLPEPAPKRRSARIQGRNQTNPSCTSPSSNQMHFEL